jgi:hypothetical protein
LQPFLSVNANVDIDARNVAFINPKNLLFDLDHVDAVPDLAFNEDIWMALKGKNSLMPPPRRSGFVQIVDSEKED